MIYALSGPNSVPLGTMVILATTRELIAAALIERFDTLVSDADHIRTVRNHMEDISAPGYQAYVVQYLDADDRAVAAFGAEVETVGMA